MDLSVIVVNWNGAALTAACLDSLGVGASRAPRTGEAVASWPAFEVILVDNGSAPRERDAVRALAQARRVRLIENQANLGFAQANNEGIAAARGRYLLLLNNDARATGDALAALVRLMDSEPDVGIAGGRLVGEDGQLQVAFDLFPLTPWQLAWERILDTLWPGNGRTRQCRTRRWGDDPQERLDVDWVLGAALIARREMIEQVGPLDERYPMYGEDIDWCFRAKRAGWRVAYVPQATFVHLGGGSSRHDRELAGRLAHQRDRGLVRFYLKHHGPLAAAGMWLVLAVKRMRCCLLRPGAKRSPAPAGGGRDG